MRPFLSYAIPALALSALAGAFVAAAAPAERAADGGAATRAPAHRAAASVAEGRASGAAGNAAADAVAAELRAALQYAGRPHAFYFTRGIYSDGRGGGGFGGFGRGGGSWRTDYPKADLQFLTVLRRVTNMDAYNSEHAVALEDPELRRYPFLYMLEVGRMFLTPPEVEGLRGYMLAGGFVFIDDFWNLDAWQNFEYQMKQVLPEHTIVDLPLDHAIFRSFYEIREVQQMPAINVWRSGGTTECYGCEVAVRGIFDHDGRLMMIIHWNSDNGDAWEWAEQPDIPLKFSTYAYQIGVNAIVYAMTQ